MYKILLPLLILFISCGEDNGNSNDECSIRITQNGALVEDVIVDCSYDGYNTYSVSGKDLDIGYVEWGVWLEFEAGVVVGEGTYGADDFKTFTILHVIGSGLYYTHVPDEQFTFTISEFDGPGGYMRAEFSGLLWTGNLPLSPTTFRVNITSRVID